MKSIQILIDVFKQHFEVSEQSVCLRIATGKEAICTPHDAQARYGSKHKMIGYKAQLVETAERGQSNFIIEAVADNNASHDNGYASLAAAKLVAKDLSPGNLYVDQGYTAGSEIASCQALGVNLLGPVSKSELDFTLVREDKTVTCPVGKQSRYYSEKTDGDIIATFSPLDCFDCPSGSSCQPKISKYRGKTKTFGPGYEHLVARRAEQKTESFGQAMKNRNAIEGTISALKRGYNLARCRYRGAPKFALQLMFTVTAYNIGRMAKAMA